MSVQKQPSEDWLDVGNMSGSSGPITDITIVNKKETKYPDYHLIENSYDGKRANFSEGGFIGKTTRYLCFSRTNGKRGFVLVTDMKVLPASDRPPIGYMPLSTTMDDNTKAFQSKQLLVKFQPQTEVTEAVTDLIVLSVSKKEDVPSGYKRLPEINGFSICFKLGPVAKKRSSEAKSSDKPTKSSSTEATVARAATIFSSKKIRSAVDGLQFKLAADSSHEDNLVKFAINQFNLLTLQEVENKYDHDFSTYTALLTSSN